jgi:hypothetical protein
MRKLSFDDTTEESVLMCALRLYAEQCQHDVQVLFQANSVQSANYMLERECVARRMMKNIETNSRLNSELEESVKQLDNSLSSIDKLKEALVTSNQWKKEFDELQAKGKNLSKKICEAMKL